MQFQISSRRKSRKAGEVEPPTKFSKRGGGLTGPQLLVGGDFFQGVAIFT